MYSLWKKKAYQGNMLGIGWSSTKILESAKTAIRKKIPVATNM